MWGENGPPASPDHLLRSGWDDSWRSDMKSARVLPSKVTPLCVVIPDTRAQSSPTPSEADSESSFAESTMHYLGSPTGRRALGTEPAVATEPTPTPRKPSEGEISIISGITGSILSYASWPEPPTAIPATPPPFSTMFYSTASLPSCSANSTRYPSEISRLPKAASKHRLRLGGSRELRMGPRGDDSRAVEGIQLTVVTEVVKDAS
jgi:pheromone a factor receptor